MTRFQTEGMHVLAEARQRTLRLQLGEVGDERALALHPEDAALALKLIECLPHGDPADAELLHELQLRRHVTGLQSPGLDAPGHDLRHLLVQRMWRLPQDCVWYRHVGLPRS